MGLFHQTTQRSVCQDWIPYIHMLLDYLERECFVIIPQKVYQFVTVRHYHDIAQKGGTIRIDLFSV